MLVFFKHKLLPKKSKPEDKERLEEKGNKRKKKRKILGGPGSKSQYLEQTGISREILTLPIFRGTKLYKTKTENAQYVFVSLKMMTRFKV
jgi:hypothetical protein